MQNHQADSPLYVWPDVWSNDLQVKQKYGHTWYRMSLLRRGVIKQHSESPSSPVGVRWGADAQFQITSMRINSRRIIRRICACWKYHPEALKCSHDHERGHAYGPGTRIAFGPEARNLHTGPRSATCIRARDPYSIRAWGPKCQYMHDTPELTMEFHCSKLQS